MLKCVLTGGPCAGKTAIMSRLMQALEERGYKVLVVPETATELILNGIVPGDKIPIAQFQNLVLEKQLSKEAIYDEAAAFFGDRTIILYDRGLLDGRAYVDEDTFNDLLATHQISLENAFGHYDVVLHLVSAADGAEAFYQWNDPAKPDPGNNAARSETPQEAREKDRRTMQAWIGHPHLRVFDNSTDFEGKIERVISEIFNDLGEPIPKEIERKFLIRKPDRKQMEALGFLSQTEIVQTYLKSENPQIERRVRRRGSQDSGYSYYLTEKTDHGFGERIEEESRISKEQYRRYLKSKDPDLSPIEKTRTCFVCHSQYFELDTYPFSDELAILEVEVNDIDEPIDLPPVKGNL